MVQVEAEEKLIKAAIESDVFFRSTEKFVYPKSGWIFDFRKIILRGDVLEAFAQIFYERFKGYERLQVGGMESAAIPLVTAIVAKFFQQGRKINAFYIRKSRKKTGLLNIVEGALEQGVPVVLVDDLMNKGSSFQKQVEVLRNEGVAVTKVFSLLRFRELSYYSYFHENGIPIESVFTLRDFKESLGTDFLKEVEPPPSPSAFDILWRFAASNPKFHKVIPKSGVAFLGERVYFGSDSGDLWCLNAVTGEVIWSFRAGRGSLRKVSIYSTPVLHGGNVHFGASNGKVYCLNGDNGQKIWSSHIGNAVSGSLVMTEKGGQLIAPAIFGLWKKRGGIVAINSKSGKVIWEHQVLGGVVGTPVYSNKHRAVYFGDDAGHVYAIGQLKGERVWTNKIGGDIEGSLALDEGEKRLVGQSMNGRIRAFNAATGEMLWTKRYEESGFASNAVISGTSVYSASLDKKLYCLHVETGEELWNFETGGRIFASPLVVGERLYIGSNDGVFYCLDATSGGQQGYSIFSERITNVASYNPLTSMFFVPTFANEVYCLRWKR